MRRLVIFCVLCCVVMSASYLYADQRPVEGEWLLPDAVAVDRTVHPDRYYFLKGDLVPLIFRIDLSDFDLFDESNVVYDIPQALHPEEETTLLQGQRGDVVAYMLQLTEPGSFTVSVFIESELFGFQLDYGAEIVVVNSRNDIPDLTFGDRSDEVLDAAEIDPTTIKVVGKPIPVRDAKAPANYAHIYGLAITYLFPSEDRRFMLRGVRLQLIEAGTSNVLATVHTNDDSGEGNCGIDFEDYIDTTSSTYHHVSDTGSYDFGNIYVGSGGMDMWIRVFYRYYRYASGTATDGVLSMAVYNAEDGDAELYTTWNIGHAASAEEQYNWLYNGTFELSATNGRNDDEAIHSQFDMSRMRRYFWYCTGYGTPFTGVYLYPTNTSAPSCSGDRLNMRYWNNNYMQYHYTDSIRHEYTHAMHWHSRGGNWPPWGPGDVNHGNCANNTSSDAVLEGFGRWVPPLIYRDARYHWTGSSTADMTGIHDYCTAPTPDDLHEWAFGRSMWQGWDEAGQTNAYADCTTDQICTDVSPPDYSEDVFMDIINNCSYDHDLWVGFNNNSIDYDTTAPPNPSPINVSPNTRWTNDTTPTWSWTVPTDDISGVDGFGLFLTTGPGVPGTTKDIEEVTNYTPAALSDHSTWHLNMRSVDYSGNWAGGYTFNGPIGIDTVDPNLVNNLQSTSHTVGQWSQNTNLVMTWTTATDDRSGVDGYGIYTSFGSHGGVGDFKDLEETATTTTESLSSSTSARYFNINTVDNAGNWTNDYAYAGPYYIDDQQPGVITNLTSTSHNHGVWSNDTSVDFTWTAAPDSHSGIDGYGLFWSTGTGSPSASKDIEEVTSYTQATGSSSSGYYLNVRSVDNAGNWDADHVSDGPYYIDAIQPGLVTNLVSTSHTPNVWSSDTTIDFTWTAAVDSHSGIDGYGLFWATSTALPSTLKDIEEVTAYIQTASTSASGYHFNIRSVDNAGNWDDTHVTSGPYYVDNVQPGNATNLISTSHTPGAWSNDTSIDFTWTAAPDSHSGIDGYGLFWSNSTSGMPGATKEIEEVTSFTQSQTSSTLAWYFKLRAVDYAGNWQPDYDYVGPYYIDAQNPGPVTNLTSPTNPVGSCVTGNANVTITWTSATDAHSNLAGYSYWFSMGTPDYIIDLGPLETSLNANIGYSTGARYFSIHASDNANNWSAVETYGPIYIDGIPVDIGDTLQGTHAGGGDVYLTWNDTGEVEFRVERCDAPDFSGVVDHWDMIDPFYTDSATPVVTCLYYRVKGVNICGDTGP